MIEITSDYGCIGEFRWMNTNQEFHFEIAPAMFETLPCTLPGWWGAAWFGPAPAALVRRLNLVTRMLTDEPRR